MIRFLDTDVFAVQKNEIDRTYVRRYFFRKGHMDDILVVYDRETYDGYITYDSYLKSSGLEDEESYIFREKYILTPNDDNMWTDLKEMFAENGGKNTLIPVFNVHGEMLYFAYEDKRDTNEALQIPIGALLEECEQMEVEILQGFFAEVYPKIRAVHVSNLNEWGYRFYKIMARCGYYMEVWGEKWEVLYPEIVKNLKANVEFLPETAFLNIYAEGTDAARTWNNSDRKIKNGVVKYWYNMLQELCSDFYSWTEERFLCKCRGVRFLKAIIPKKEDIICKKEEEHRCKLFLPVVYEIGSLEQLRCCQEVYGRGITRDEWNRRCKDKKFESIFIAGKKIEIKRFGEKSKRKIYVIGPCIVAGHTVPDDEQAFLYCLHKELERRGQKYCVIGVVVGRNEMCMYREVLDSLTIWENDMVISVFENFGTYQYQEDSRLDLSEVYNKREEYWFYDQPIHTNYAGNKAVAKAVAESILSYRKETGMIPRGGGICKLAKERLAHKSMRQWSNISGRCRMKSFREQGRRLARLS